MGLSTGNVKLSYGKKKPFSYLPLLRHLFLTGYTEFKLPVKLRQGKRHECFPACWVPGGQRHKLMHPNSFCPNELVPSESFGRPAMSGDVQFSLGTGVSLATEGLTGARASGGAWRGGHATSPSHLITSTGLVQGRQGKWVSKTFWLRFAALCW